MQRLLPAGACNDGRRARRSPGPSTPLIFLIALFALAALSAGCKKGLPLHPDATSGEELYTNCEECHGEDGQGRPELETPAIAGLGAWYIRGQLQKFQTGMRGAHAEDISGLRMRPLSRTMGTPQEIAAVAEYVASLPPQKPAKTITDADPGRGGQLYKPCEACHGADGAGSEALSAPRLNMQYDWYIAKQLYNFKHGIRGSVEGDITGAQMTAMVDSLPDEQAIRDVTAYIQKLK